MIDHPGLGHRGRRYLGREPIAYQAMRVLAQRGTMPQREFMRVYWALGAKGTSYGNHFDRYTVRAAWAAMYRSTPIIKTVVDGVTMLTWRWTVEQPDWRPTHAIAEDHYAA